jgi:hypothetical protein
MSELTKEELLCNEETRKHIDNVRKFITEVQKELFNRANDHDASKLEEPELPYFAETTPKLAGTTYNSQEYKDFMTYMTPAITHHYARNSHHPEHYKNGIEDMNLIDLIELMCDWKAATLRHNDGNLLKSVEVNADRFNICPQLVKILENTAKFLEKK